MVNLIASPFRRLRKPLSVQRKSSPKKSNSFSFFPSPSSSLPYHVWAWMNFQLLISKAKITEWESVVDGQEIRSIMTPFRLRALVRTRDTKCPEAEKLIGSWTLGQRLIPDKLTMIETMRQNTDYSKIDPQLWGTLIQFERDNQRLTNHGIIYLQTSRDSSIKQLWIPCSISRWKNLTFKPTASQGILFDASKSACLCLIANTNKKVDAPPETMRENSVKRVMKSKSIRGKSASIREKRSCAFILRCH